MVAILRLFGAMCVVWSVAACGGSDSDGGESASNTTNTSNGTGDTGQADTGESMDSGVAMDSDQVDTGEEDTNTPPDDTDMTDTDEPTDSAMADTDEPSDTDAPMDTGDDTGPEDVAMDTAAEDTSEPEDIDFPDIPMEPRPDFIQGGVSLVDAYVVANFLIRLNVGNVGAAFVETPEEVEPVMTFGACDVVNVTTTDEEQGFGYDAGDITVEAGNYDPVTLTPMRGEDDSTTYNTGYPEDHDDSFPPNADVRITTLGGPHMRGFVGTVRTPGEHTVSRPAADSTVSAEALTVAWSGGGATDVIQVTVNPFGNDYMPRSGVGLLCELEEDNGTFTIPAEAMAQMNAPRLGISVIKSNTVELARETESIFLNATYIASNLVAFSP
ncbi:MAG: hypothetical protein CMH57_01345 [Myxococcales bacterium]|nr:hypothetical protein [Myxococcales bacterium]